MRTAIIQTQIPRGTGALKWERTGSGKRCRAVSAFLVDYLRRGRKAVSACLVAGVVIMASGVADADFVADYVAGVMGSVVIVCIGGWSAASGTPMDNLCNFLRNDPTLLNL